MTATFRVDQAQHARDLAKAFKVAFIEMDIAPEEAGASVKPHGEYLGIVKVGRIVDDTTYAVALHEIGHVVAPLGGLVEEKRRLEGSAAMRMTLIAERAAWEWAEHYAADWTVGMEQVKLWALSTYEKGYQQALQIEAHRAARLAAERKPQMQVNMGTAAFAKRMQG